MQLLFQTSPGELRHIVRVEQKGTTKGTSGEEIESWTLFKNIRCKVLPLKGREIVEAKRETGKATSRFYCRYIPGINQGMRLVFKSRTFDIENIANLGEMNQELEILAVETI